MAYNSNFLNLMNGYTNYEVDKEDPPTQIFKNDTPLDEIANSRDSLSFLAGKGYTSLSDDDARANYTSLSKTVGVPLAQKLVNQIFLYNQRPEVKNFNPEQRVNGFYEIGSSDKDTGAYLRKVKNFGTGVLPGFRDSVLINNRKLTGKEIDTPPIASTSDKEKINAVISKIVK